MLKVQLKDGRTLRVDLSDEQQAREWLTNVGDLDFQSNITGATIHHHGVQYSVPRPDDADVFMFAERVAPDRERRIKGGERLICQAGDTRLTMMVHEAQKAARVNLVRTGTQRYNPFIRENG